jgi:hypothetical protein
LALLVFSALLDISAAEEGPESPGFGSGVFGEWIIDEYGMPAYKYTMRHDDPRAVWDPRTEPETSLMWHQLGNRRVNANAYNTGFVKLFYGESGAMWLNEYEPDKGEHSGGFGWVIDGNDVLVDRDELLPAEADWERVFGAGYLKKVLIVKGLIMERFIFAPSGDYPALVSEVTLTNNSGEDREYFFIEYWDVNMRPLTDALMGRGMMKRKRDMRVRLTVSDKGMILKAEPKRIFGPHGGFPDRPALIDPEPPAVFLASIDVTAEAWITSPEELFNGAAIIRDAGALRAAGEDRPDPAQRGQNSACLAARFSLSIPSGAKKTIRFVYGYEKGHAAEEIISYILEDALEDSKLGPAPGRERLSPTTMLQWTSEMPRLDLPGDGFMSRELRWDYYYLVSSSLFDAYYQRHKVPQGANYLYYSGMDGATRDYAAFVQALTYYRPELAREILELMMRCQETDGRLFYDIGGYGVRYNNPYRPGDLDLWFLWALCEYVFATRDFAFLDEEVPFYPLHRGETGAVWEHARRSLDHFINVIGTGPHGHPRLRLSDWNDEMMWLASGMNPIDMIATFMRGESVMNTAMACVTLPMLGDLARKTGDEETATAARGYLEKMRAALSSAWRDDHLIRAYSGLGRPFGMEETYLEPQAWALLAEGSLSPERERVLVDTVVTRLKKPSALGMMISTSTSGSATTRPGEQEEGGIWFAINGPAAVALSRFDRELAWDEVKKNTLAWHAHTYPQTWYGIWSGPDAWNSVFSERPSETWYMKTPIINTGPQMYPVQNAHAHCQTLWAVARLAGIAPTADGWIIEPRIPMDSYSFSCALFSIEVSPGRIGGRLDLPADASLDLKIRVPKEWDSDEIEAFISGKETAVRLSDDFAVINLRTRAVEGACWEVKADDRAH